MFRKITLATALLLTSASAFALESTYSEKNAYFGGLVGANYANGSSEANTNTNFGITAGARVAPNFGLGFYGTYYGENHTDSIFGLPTGTSTRTFNLAGELNFFLSVLHIGADAGIGINTWNGNIGRLNASSSDNSFIYGPEAGIDIPLGASSVSIGGEVHYLFTSAKEGQSNLQALAALKVWL